MRRNRRHPLTRRRLLVAGILLLTLAVRVLDVQETGYRAVNDAGTYNRFASTIALHGDYRTGDGPGTGAGGSRGPTAYFPPAYPYALAVVDLLDGHTAGHRAALHGERLAGAVLGTLTVGLIGLVGLEALGAGPALAAMALAAVYPVLVELSGLLLAENLLVVLELAAVYAGLRARRAMRRSRFGWIAGAGVLIGLAALAHENGLLLLLPVAVVVGARGRPLRRRLAAVALLVCLAAMTLAPWAIRNAVELHRFVPISDETGITLRGTYNAASAATRPIDWKWRFFWDIPADADLRHTAEGRSEVDLGDRLEHRALRFIAAHPTAPASVAWHNLRRMFELEGTAAWRASARAVDLPLGAARVGVVAFWIVCLLALAGLTTRPVRAGPRWIWAVPVLFALSVVFVNVETPRFRAPLEPFFLLLAGAAVSDALTRLRRSHHERP